MMENWETEDFSPPELQSGEEECRADNTLNYVTKNGTATSRFPKLPDVGSQGIRPPPRSAPHVAGLAQMSSFNITPRAFTPHRLGPTGSFYRYEVPEENLTGRFTRSRSLNQHCLQQQQHRGGIDGPCYTQSAFHDSQTSQRKYKSRPTPGSNSNYYVPPHARRHSEQPYHFRPLPMDICQKVHDEYPGTIITNYFGSGVTVALLINDNIDDHNMCHVIFTTNPETQQYWLIAFSKKTRSREGNISKFNRLLTGNMNIELCGKTAVLIGPPNNAAFNPNNVEKHLFNFCEENEAFRFCQSLERGRSSVWNWNNSELRHRNQSKLGLAFHQSQILGIDRGNGTHIIPNANTKRTFCRPHPEFRVTAEQDCYNYLEGQGSILRQTKPWNVKVALPLIRFTADRIQLFVQIGTAYTLLGVGKISILQNPSGLEELIFRGPRNEIICGHTIYSWTQPKLFHQNSVWECTWSAAANLLITINPNQMPTIRELKIVGEEEVILQFYRSFQASVSAALVYRMAAYGIGDTN